jgi:hypothetical protein
VQHLEEELTTEKVGWYEANDAGAIKVMVAEMIKLPQCDLGSLEQWVQGGGGSGASQLHSIGSAAERVVGELVEQVMK